MTTDENEDGSPNVSDRHLMLVGRVTSNWSLFETMIDMAIWHLADVEDNSGACLTAQIAGSARKLDALISLFHLHYPAESATLKRLQQAAEKSRDLAEKRNRVVHDHWRLLDGKPSRLEITARKRLIFGPVSVSEDDLFKLADEVTHHANEFWKLLKPYLQFPDDE